jgi:hypothetical protein
MGADPRNNIVAPVAMLRTFVGDDGATRGNRRLHRLDEDVGGRVVEGRKPARLHEHALSIGEVSIECAQ